MTTNLIGTLADPLELSRPPPEIRLPPNACLSQNPQANADPSYMRSTINSIPTTGALLNKSKLPFALVLTPQRSLQEGDVSYICLIRVKVYSLTKEDIRKPSPLYLTVSLLGVADAGHTSIHTFNSSTVAIDGSVFCAICRTKYHNCSTGIKRKTSLQIAGVAWSSTTHVSNTSHR